MDYNYTWTFKEIRVDDHDSKMIESFVFQYTGVDKRSGLSAIKRGRVTLPPPPAEPKDFADLTKEDLIAWSLEFWGNKTKERVEEADELPIVDIVEYTPEETLAILQEQIDIDIKQQIARANKTVTVPWE